MLSGIIITEPLDAGSQAILHGRATSYLKNQK